MSGMAREIKYRAVDLWTPKLYPRRGQDTIKHTIFSDNRIGSETTTTVAATRRTGYVRARGEIEKKRWWKERERERQGSLWRMRKNYGSWTKV